MFRGLCRWSHVSMEHLGGIQITLVLLKITRFVERISAEFHWQNHIKSPNRVTARNLSL